MSELKNGKLSVTVDVNLNLVNPDHKDIIVWSATISQCAKTVQAYTDTYKRIAEDSYMHYSAGDIAGILEDIHRNIIELHKPESK